MSDNITRLLQQYEKILGDAHKHTLLFLLIGRTGVGKSSTVNTLLGKDVAKVGPYEPTTMEVVPYDFQIDGVRFVVVDTPGLCDDIEEKGDDLEYLLRIQSAVPAIDSMWFVSRLDDTRVTSDEKRAIKLISEAFGKGVWDNSLIIFTFACNIESGRYHDALTQRTRLIKSEISRYTKEKTASDIPSVAIDNKSPKTPDGNEWLGELFTQVVVRLSAHGTAPFILAMAPSVLPPSRKVVNHEAPDFVESKGPFVDEGRSLPDTPRISLTRDQKKQVNKKIDAYIIPGLIAAGAGVGAVFGPAGAAIGGIAGAAIGLVAWLHE